MKKSLVNPEWRAFSLKAVVARAIAHLNHRRPKHVVADRRQLPADGFGPGLFVQRRPLLHGLGSEPGKVSRFSDLPVAST